MVPKTCVTTDVYILNSNHLVEYEVCKSNIGHKLNGSKCCKKRLQGRGGEEGRRKMKLEKNGTGNPRPIQKQHLVNIVKNENSHRCPYNTNIFIF